MPGILGRHAARDPAPIFAIASDRNAYVPVHHPEYSQPQRAGEWVWNDVNSRNRRIMERWQALVASRNREPTFQKVFLRHMNDGLIVPIKIFSSPIFVQNEFWGNFQIGYYY